MRCRHVVLLAGVFTLFLFATSERSEAQVKENFERVRFTSVDGVELFGAFHQSNKATAPTVLLLHALNTTKESDDSNKKEWVALAEKLQKDGYNVLRFDFRGHGNSKDLDAPTFWGFKHNAALVRGFAQKKATIEFKDMDPKYYPVLVNDIAAAKAFLDFRHDAGRCNTNSLFVIGAETGATLGAIWLASEWHRHLFTPAELFKPAEIKKQPEGRDVIGCVWLSISPKLGTRTLSLSKTLEVPARGGATGMTFFYSEGDATGKTLAKALEKNLKGTKKEDKDKYRYTAAVEVKGAGKLAGAKLLTKSLPTEAGIVDYLNTVKEAKFADWVERDFRKNEYVWLPGPLQAKTKNEKTFVYDSYERFLK